MTDHATVPGPGPGRPSALAAAVARLGHPGARRQFTVVGSDGPAARDGAGWAPLASVLDPASVAARQGADPMAPLGIPELTTSMAFHGLVVPVVDLTASLLVTSGVGVTLDPSRLWARRVEHAIVAVALSEGLPVLGSPADADADADVAADVVDEVADQLVAVLDPVVGAITPADPEARWGAVADLVAILGLGRQRALAAGAGPSATVAWARVAALVGALRDRRPAPPDAPTVLTLDVRGHTVTVARRATCCAWYRAARQLGEESVGDARCADCPSLDVAANQARLTVLAEAGDLAAP